MATPDLVNIIYYKAVHVLGTEKVFHNIYYILETPRNQHVLKTELLSCLQWRAPSHRDT